MRSRHELLEGEGRRRGWRGLGLQHPHELLVALAGLEGLAALGQGGEGAGTPLCLRPSELEQSQGHLRGGGGGVGSGAGGGGRTNCSQRGRSLTFRVAIGARVWGRGEQ